MTPPTASEGSALAVEAPPDGDDIFGPSRSYLPRTNRPKPSMISAKLRAKEERKKVMQICSEKLDKIKDPDRNLRRSVCINNTYFKLQDELRREKQMKHAGDEVRARAPRRGTPDAEQKQRMLDKALESIDKELSAIDAGMPGLDHEMLPEDMGIVDSSIGPLRDGADGSFPSLSLELAFRTDGYSGKGARGDAFGFSKSDSPRCRSRKRSFDEVEDCDVHEVLSQFYMPPTPRLISTIDDDVLPSPAEKRPDARDGAAPESAFESGFDEMLELDTDLNRNRADFQTLNEFEPLAKRARREEERCPRGGAKCGKSEFEIILDALRLDERDGKECCERDELVFFCSGGGVGGNGKGDKASVEGGGELRARLLGVVHGAPAADSCGQAAILGDQQAAGFHGLVASLET